MKKARGLGHRGLESKWVNMDATGSPERVPGVNQMKEQDVFDSFLRILYHTFIEHIF